MMRAIAMALMIGISVPAYGQGARPPEVGWITDDRTGCRLWHGVPLILKSVTWSGGCQNGLAFGLGEAAWTYPTWTTLYRGGMLAGKYEGKGVLTHSFGGGYDGEYRQGLPHGTGIARWGAGERYEGQWANGQPNGFGTFTTRDGQTYTGQWTKGCFRDGQRKFALITTPTACGFD